MAPPFQRWNKKIETKNKVFKKVNKQINMTTLQKFKEEVAKTILQNSIHHIQSGFDKENQYENRTIVIEEKSEKYKISKHCFAPGVISKEYYEEYTVHYDGIIDGKKITVNPGGRFWLQWKNQELVPIYKINVSCKTAKPTSPVKPKYRLRFKISRQIFSKFLEKVKR